jgi:hypothetical protein
MDIEGFGLRPAIHFPSGPEEALTPINKSAQFDWDFEREALVICETNPRAALRFVDAVDPFICWRSIQKSDRCGVTEIQSIRLATSSCPVSTTT